MSCGEKDILFIIGLTVAIREEVEPIELYRMSAENN